MTRIVTLSYIIEDGEWKTSDKDAGLFKNLGALMAEDTSKDMHWGGNVEEMLEKWLEEVNLPEGDLDEEFEEKKNRFLAMLTLYELDRHFVVVKLWGVEYDVSLSFVIS